MTPEPETNSARPRPSRRTVLKTAAWAVPVIAVAAPAPALAASGIAPCTFEPIWEFATAGPGLVQDGRTGVTPQQNGWFGTGWTPAIASVPNDGSCPKGQAQDGCTWSQVDGSVDPTPAGWFNGGGNPAGSLGFLSLDDHNNNPDDPNTSDDPSTVTATLQFSAIAGTSYVLKLPVWVGADYNGAQFFDLSYAGAGNPVTPVLKGYFGDASISVIPAPYDDPSVYPHFNGGTGQPLDDPRLTVTVVASASGLVTFTYTFTLMRVTGGSFQNADIWVEGPEFVSCQ